MLYDIAHTLYYKYLETVLHTAWNNFVEIYVSLISIFSRKGEIRERNATPTYTLLRRFYTTFSPR